MQKVVINSNLNSPLKLFFFSPILTNNNLLLKIYCENIVVKFLNQDLSFFILFFILSFHSPPHTCPLSPFFYFFFSSRTFQQHLICSSLFLKKKKFAILIREKRETEIEREEKDWERSAWASTACISTAAPASPPPGWVRSACLLFFFFFFILACSDSNLF